MIIKDVHTLILIKKEQYGLVDVELYGPEEGYQPPEPTPTPPTPKKLAEFHNLVDVTLEDVENVETTMIMPEMEVFFKQPVTCLAEADEAYIKDPTSKVMLDAAGVSDPKRLICGVPPKMAKSISDIRIALYKREL